jgi:nitroreductase
VPISLELRNQVFDEITANRQSIRVFMNEIPPRASIEMILRAGLAAPYAKMAIGTTSDFRRFIIFTKASKALETLIDILREKCQAQLQALTDREPQNPQFFKRLEAGAEGRLPGLSGAPYLIVVAELMGVPHVEQQSIAHCLENMWLKATALDLGFHIVSALAMLSDESRFWNLCNLPCGCYDVNGCAIGIPAVSPPARTLPLIDRATIWMS